METCHDHASHNGMGDCSAADCKGRWAGSRRVLEHHQMPGQPTCGPRVQDDKAVTLLLELKSCTTWVGPPAGPTRAHRLAAVSRI